MGETTISRLVDKVNELSDSVKELRDQLAAKDAEIAELREWRFKVCERLGLSCAAGAEWSPKDVFDLVQSEARECVGRLYKTLDAVLSSDEIDLNIVNMALATIAATPEHLR